MNYKYIIFSHFISLFLFTSLCSSQKTIISDKTNEGLTLIPGTRIYLELPSGFQLSKDFIGLENGDNEIIRFYDMYGTDYYADSNKYSKKAYEKIGAIVYDFEETIIDDYYGKVVVTNSDYANRVVTLVFGDAFFSVLAVAVTNNTNNTEVSHIINSFKSIKYDKDREIGSMEAAFFSINIEKSGFKLFFRSNEIFHFTEKGEEPTDVNVSSYVINQMLVDPANPNLNFIVDNVINSSIEKGFKVAGRKQTSKDNINGYHCFQELVYGESEGVETQIVFTVIQDGRRALAIMGSAKENFQENIEKFNQLTSTIKFK
ncbi:hypothetical protein [Zobellia laminariae]|uniref:hypothetical protein n=1 Tax=Zobellia laminariae TaxID=248906 RepID=UPI0026F42EC3|nr:hypothetical protein [Zobellia laminariae]WKX76137.1 hypothetical protein Q5W13_21625 [Zobellia laminariae]